MSDSIKNKISEELKKKLAACKSAGEAKKILADAGIEALDDDLLAQVAGGLIDPDFISPYSRPYKPREML